MEFNANPETVKQFKAYFRGKRKQDIYFMIDGSGSFAFDGAAYKIALETALGTSRSAAGNSTGNQYVETWLWGGEPRKAFSSLTPEDELKQTFWRLAGGLNCQTDLLPALDRLRGELCTQRARNGLRPTTILFVTDGDFTVSSIALSEIDGMLTKFPNVKLGFIVTGSNLSKLAENSISFSSGWSKYVKPENEKRLSISACTAENLPETVLKMMAPVKKIAPTANPLERLSSRFDQAIAKMEAGLAEARAVQAELANFQKPSGPAPKA